MIKKMGIHGSMDSVPLCEVNVDTVYLRENVVRVDIDEQDGQSAFHGWKYDETQLTYGEYIDILQRKIRESESLINELSAKDLDNKMALAEIYEMLI